MSSNDASSSAPAPESWTSQPLGQEAEIDIGQEPVEVTPGEPIEGSEAGIPEPAPTDKTQPEAAAEETTGALSQSDKDWAKGMGLTEETISAFPNAESLRAALGGIVSLMTTASQQPAQQQQQTTPTQQPQQQATIPESLRIDLTKYPGYELMDEEQQQVVQGVAEHSQGLVLKLAQAFQSEVASLRSALNEMTESRYMGKLRDSLGKLDGEWKSIAPQYAGEDKLGEVLHQMNAVAESYLKAGRQPPTWDALMHTVLYSRHSKELAEAVAAQRREALKNNNAILANHAAGPGSARRSKGLSGGRQSAVAEVAEILRR